MGTGESACKGVYVCVWADIEECVCREACPSFLKLDGKHQCEFTGFGTAGTLCGEDGEAESTECTQERSEARRQTNLVLRRWS